MTRRVVPPIALACLAFAVAACESRTPVAGPGAEECARRILDLRAFLNDLGQLQGTSPVALGPGIRLVPANIANADAPAAGKPLAQILPGTFVICGKPLGAGQADLAARLDEELARVAEEAAQLQTLRKGGAWPKKLLVAVDQQAPWGHLVLLSRAAARAGFEHLVLLFAPHDRPGLARPGRSPIDARLDEIRAIADPVKKAPRMAGLARSLTEDCEELDRVFRSLSVTNPETRTRLLATRLPEAIQACACRVDLASLKVLLWAMFARITPIAARFDISAEPVEGEYRIAQLAHRPWHQAHLMLLSVVRPGFSPRIRLQSHSRSDSRFGPGSPGEGRLDR